MTPVKTLLERIEKKMENRRVNTKDVQKPSEVRRQHSPHEDIVRTMTEENVRRDQKSKLPERDFALSSDRLHAFNSVHKRLRTDYQALKEADSKSQEMLARLSSGESGGKQNLSDWSRLSIDSQTQLKQLESFLSPNRQQARAFLQKEANALASKHDQLDHATQTALRETGDLSQTLETSQEMKQRAQTTFFQSSEAMRKILHTDKITAGKDFESFVPAFIKRYTNSNPEQFSRFITKINAEQAKDGKEKVVGINYYNPVDRVFIAYSNSRDDQADFLKPLREGETKKEIYQRTIAHSEEMYHIQKATTDAHNQRDTPEKVSLQDMRDLTIVRHSLSNEIYKEMRPSLNLTDAKKDYTQKDPEFQSLMNKVPNFKAVKRLLSQHYPHLEVQQMTILPNAVADAAILYALPKPISTQ
jgi:hypothetical protein